ncbi:MAG: hypothetical protein JNL70_27375 [Saprospiraceae bacterium]|nr:hypothetical protein [Saprospiraceae bacterium]
MTHKLIFFFSILSIISACRKTETGIDMTYRRQFEIPVGLSPGPSHNFVLKSIPSDTAVFFKINNITADQLLGVLPRSMNLRTIFQGTGNTFSIVDRVEVVIFDPSRPDIPEIPIFYRYDVPLSTGDRLDLVPDASNIKKFVLDGKTFDVRIKFFFRDFIPRSFEVETNIVFLGKTS